MSCLLYDSHSFGYRLFGMSFVAHNFAFDKSLNCGMNISQAGRPSCSVNVFIDMIGSDLSGQSLVRSRPFPK